jgi:hypothetical protein
MTERLLTSGQKEKALKDAREVIAVMAQAFPPEKALEFSAAAQAYVAALNDQQLIDFARGKR